MRLAPTVATAALTSLLSLSAAAGEGDAEYREHTMEAIGGHMQAMVDIIRQKVLHATHMTLHANALADLAGIADIRNLIRRATGSGECRLHP